jgi:hypothetical protein
VQCGYHARYGTAKNLTVCREPAAYVRNGTGFCEVHRCKHCFPPRMRNFGYTLCWSCRKNKARAEQRCSYKDEHGINCNTIALYKKGETSFCGLHSCRACPLMSPTIMTDGLDRCQQCIKDERYPSLKRVGTPAEEPPAKRARWTPIALK